MEGEFVLFKTIEENDDENELISPKLDSHFNKNLKPKKKIK